MPVARSSLLSMCRRAFGGDAERTLSLLITKLEMLHLSLRQVTWATRMKDKNNGPLIQLNFRIPRGPGNSRRRIRFNEHLQVVFDETKEPRPIQLGFGQKLERDHNDDPDQARRDMGDYQ